MTDPTTIKEITCKTCGVKFSRPSWRNAIYCSKKCKPAWNKGFKGLGICVANRKGVKLSDETKRKISLAQAHRINPNASEDRRERKSTEFKNWRKEVFERDGYLCRSCQEKKKIIHPHHLLSFAKYKEDRFNVDNGITLCEDCHKLFHKTYGRVNFQPIQIVTMLPLFKQYQKLT